MMKVKEQTMKVLFFFLNLMLCIVYSQAYRNLELSTFSIDQLKSPSKDQLEVMRRVLQDVGMLAVTPTAGATRSAGRIALQAFSDCVQDRDFLSIFQDNQESEVVREVVLDDGTLRRTVATAANHSTLHPLQPLIAHTCPMFDLAGEQLRRRVDDVGVSFAHLLDLLSDDGRPSTDSAELSGSSSSTAVTSFEEAVQQAESLEHFHLFQEPAQGRRDAGKPTLHMHSDMGLFIVMTPGEFFPSHHHQAAPGEQQEKEEAKEEKGGQQAEVPESGRGLFLELASGEIVAPKFPRDCLLVLGGEGAARWVSRPTAVPLRAPAHEVVLPGLKSGALVRAWYGRMFFPPRSAPLLLPHDDPLLAARPANHTHQVPTSLTFGELREQTYSAFLSGKPSEAITAGCHPVRRSLADEESCTGEQIYCWMSCQSTADLECDKEEALCRSPSGALWPQDFTDSSGSPTHCTECKPVCPASQTPETKSGELCNSYFQPTVMWMTGFQALGDEGTPCVALLFEEWTLNTPVKFIFGCIGTFFMAVSVEGIVCTRRFISKTVKVKTAENTMNSGMISPFAAKQLIRFGMMCMYGVQVTLGYALMLIAMTYQVELFVMVVCGLTFGHFMFNLKAPVTESAEACCQGHDAEPSPTESPITTPVVSTDGATTYPTIGGYPADPPAVTVVDVGTTRVIPKHASPPRPSCCS